jgi:hypothetical protein
MTWQEIEQKMDALAREYHDTHDPEIPEEIYKLAGQLREIGTLKVNQDFTDVHCWVGLSIF